MTIIERVLRESRQNELRITPATRIDSLAIESLELVEVLVALEDLCGCVVSVEDLRAVEVIADLAGVSCLEI